MRFYSVRRAWTSMLAVGVPLALLTVVWTVFLGGRPAVAGLAVAYLLIAVAGRAQAIKQERDERPYRAERVAHQLERIRSTLPDL